MSDPSPPPDSSTRATEDRQPSAALPASPPPSHTTTSEPPQSFFSFFVPLNNFGGNDAAERGPSLGSGEEEPQGPPQPSLEGIGWSFEVFNSNPFANLMNPSPAQAPAGQERQDVPEPTATEPDGAPTALTQPPPALSQHSPPEPPHIPFPFSFFLPFNLGASNQPSPEKGRELLRALPDVGKDILRRIDRVSAAEQVDEGDAEERKGWRCGICLEGVPEESVPEERVQEGVAPYKGEERERVQEGVAPYEGEDKEVEQDVEMTDAKKSETGVKNLPCNHLFHADCLEPWFATRHTCPTCRLNLDPFATLSTPPPTRTNPLRPSATGSGRSSPHPYTRTVPPPAQPTSTPNGLSSPSITEADAVSSRRSPLPFPSIGIVSRSAAPSPSPQPDQPSRPSTPETPRLGVPSQFPTHASPLPMDSSQRPTSDLHPNLNPPDVPNGSGSRFSNGRPVPERRHHITVIRGGAQDMMNRFHQHLLNEHRASTRSPTPDRPANAETDSAVLETNQVVSSSETDPAAPGPNPVHPDTDAGVPITDTASPEARPPPPHRRYPFEIFVGFPTPRGGGAPPRSEPKDPPFVPIPLETWVSDKERVLGWKCDSVECLYDPEIDRDGDRELLSIYAETQPVFQRDPQDVKEHHENEFLEQGGRGKRVGSMWKL
ncbi:hypothetical protein P7C73_g6366, partial [Tremellales sp. Uapishka_1]